MSTIRACQAELEAAIQERTLVRITRSPRNADRIDGFVLAKGTKWVLIAETRDGGYFDGLVAVRLKDVVKVVPDSSFAAQFARTRREWPLTPPANVDLDKTSRLISSLSKISPLLGIEQEGRFKSAMQWIGVIDEIESGWLWLREVRPDATWHAEPLGYKLRRISKVTVSGEYQTALAAISGSAPDV